MLESSGKVERNNKMKNNNKKKKQPKCKITKIQSTSTHIYSLTNTQSIIRNKNKSSTTIHVCMGTVYSVHEHLRHSTFYACVWVYRCVCFINSSVHGVVVAIFSVLFLPLLRRFWCRFVIRCCCAQCCSRCCCRFFNVSFLSAWHWKQYSNWMENQ